VASNDEENSVHRVYLRWPPQRTSDKTSTESAEVARFAYDELRNRRDLVGLDVAAAWTCNGKQLAFHSFNSTLPSIDAARTRLQKNDVK